MQHRERIVVNEDGADLLREMVTREASPSTDLAEWAGTGPARGEWEAANDVRVEYLRPTRRAA